MQYKDYYMMMVLVMMVWCLVADDQNVGWYNVVDDHVVIMLAL